MKKFIKIATALTLLAVLIIGIAACGEKGKASEAKAYGLVHNYYVGIANVKTAADRTVTEVSFEEVMTPYDWANSKNMSSTIDENSNFFTEGYAKKIMIGDKVFDGKIVSDGKKTFADYQCKELNDGVTLLNWLKNDSNAKWYAEKIMSGNYHILKEDGSKLDVTYKTASNGADLDKGSRWLKSKNGYWTVEEGLGWKGNMEKVSKFFISDGLKEFDSVTRVENKNNAEKIEWIIGGNNTGATLVDFNDYINLAKIAYSKAVK